MARARFHYKVTDEVVLCLSRKEAQGLVELFFAGVASSTLETLRLKSLEATLASLGFKGTFTTQHDFGNCPAVL